MAGEMKKVLKGVRRRGMNKEPDTDTDAEDDEEVSHSKEG